MVMHIKCLVKCFVTDLFQTMFTENVTMSDSAHKCVRLLQFNKVYLLSCMPGVSNGVLILDEDRETETFVFLCVTLQRNI